VPKVPPDPNPAIPPAAGEGAAKAPDADTVDADFEVVDDEKKEDSDK
jgi:hypothetical protein